jgi:ankyrin repeat protein
VFDFDADRLHAAAQDGDLDEVRRLLAEGLDVNAFDEISMTPLHYAAEHEHLEVCRCLIGAGANVNAHEEAKIGDTPLRLVAARCSLALAALLIEAGADPTIPGWMQLTALDDAKERKRGDGPAVYDLLLRTAHSRERI